jgi:signal transduction histidine kinase
VGLPADFDLEATGSLGLSIVRTLVGELGGRLSLGPRPDGPGTRVEVALPRVAGRTADSPAGR